MTAAASPRRGAAFVRRQQNSSPDQKTHFKPDEFRTTLLCNQNINWTSRPRGVGLPLCRGLPVALRGSGDSRGAPPARTRPRVPAGRPPPAPSALSLPPSRTPGQIPKNDTRGRLRDEPPVASTGARRSAKLRSLLAAGLRGTSPQRRTAPPARGRPETRRAQPRRRRSERGPAAGGQRRRRCRAAPKASHKERGGTAAARGEGSARRGRPRGLTWDICGRKLISLRLMEWLRRLLSSWHSSTPSRSVCARSKTWAVSQVTRWLGGSTLQLISHCPHCFHGSIPATLRPRRPPLRPPPPPPRPARPASHRSAPARPVRRGPTAPSRGLRCVRARLRAGPAVRSP